MKEAYIVNSQEAYDRAEEERSLSSNEFFMDDKDFFSKFIFTPNINEDADFRHLDKNLAITKLSSRYQEPEKARSILRALHVLSNPKYFREIPVQKLIGHREEEIETTDSQGNKVVLIKKIPVYQEIKKFVSFYPKAYHSLKSRFYSLTTTSMARDGHLLRGATTKNLNRSESIEDRTKKSSGFFGLTSPTKKDY